MRCDDIVLNLPDYILGKIEPNLRRSVEYHLDMCPKCRSEFESMREPIRLLGEIEVEEYPDSFWQELHLSIMERVSHPASARSRVPVFAGALAVLMLVAAVGILEFSHNKSTIPPQNVAALTSTISPQQAVALPSMNINYVNAISSQARELDEMDAVDDSLQQAIVNALWSSVGDSAEALDAAYYSSSSFSN